MNLVTLITQCVTLGVVVATLLRQKVIRDILDRNGLR